MYQESQSSLAVVVDRTFTSRGVDWHHSLMFHYSKHYSSACLITVNISTGDVIDVIRPLGSSGDLVFLLLSPTLMCGVGLDCEFGRVVVHNYLMIDTSVKPYQDPGLPHRVGQVVSHAFRSPLLFTLCEDGHVCILTAP